MPTPPRRYRPSTIIHGGGTRATSDAHKRWIAQWREAAAALAALREQELRELTDEQALVAADRLLSLALAASPDEARLLDSGLVRQQALLHRRAAR